MQRTLEFLKWKSTNWLTKVPPSVVEKLLPSMHVLKGLTAYTFQQAEVFLSLHDHFSSLWHGLTVVVGFTNQLPSTPVQVEDEMLGIDGGDI